MRRDARFWARAAGVALTLAMVAGLARRLADGGLASLGGGSPTGFSFYLAALLLYLVPPLADLAIFRRLWGVPLRAGLAACLKKRIANEVAFGYAGETYFYAWARARGAGDKPFEAVKDVAVLSALAGNLLTLAALAAALPFAAGEGGRFAWPAAALVAMTLPFLLLRGRVFSLPGSTLRWVFGVHVFRILLTSAFATLAWAAMAPGVGAGTWALLAAGRLLVSRLPLVPNKELVFASLAALWLDDATALSSAVALLAALTLAANLAVMTLLGGWGVISAGRR